MEVEDIQYFDVKDIPNSSYSVVLAKRRGGKSTLVGDLVNKLFEAEKIDCCCLFSETDADFPQISKKHRFKDINKLQEIITNYEVMNEYNKIADPPNKFKIKTLIILDDLLLKLKSKDFQIIQNLAVNGRHVAYKPLSLHIVILAQNLTSIPRLVRNNVDHIFFNSISSQKELELILDENFYITSSTRSGKQEAREFYNKLVTSEPYLFICCQNYKSNVKTYSDYVRKYVVKLDK